MMPSFEKRTRGLFTICADLPHNVYYFPVWNGAAVNAVSTVVASHWFVSSQAIGSVGRKTHFYVQAKYSLCGGGGGRVHALLFLVDDK